MYKSYWMQAFENMDREYDIPQLCLCITDAKASLLFSLHGINLGWYRCLFHCGISFAL